MGRGKTTDIDECIGKNLQRFRLYKNMSQEKLAVILGVSPQQVQKYEKGTNRLPAAKIHRLHTYFGISMEYFFTGYHGNKNKNKGLIDMDPRMLRIVSKINSVQDTVLKEKIRKIIDILVA
ncbi:MAG: hypothetical protein CO093_09555 [Alphaproteobacteria bacterium CG_4_9_14_3_um_filter_47_13]|nr:MAG: hypothetical protein CO093_09555 [Alphaproteobacteria bacterium CG_4_9_14_3_um_filter_47_13]